MNALEIMEVIDIYHYKEPQSQANDYACVCLKIKDQALIDLYDGNPYLF
jgi:hypothetical protein